MNKQNNDDNIYICSFSFHFIWPFSWSLFVVLFSYDSHLLLHILLYIINLIHCKFCICTEYVAWISSSSSLSVGGICCKSMSHGHMCISSRMTVCKSTVATKNLIVCDRTNIQQCDIQIRFIKTNDSNNNDKMDVVECCILMQILGSYYPDPKPLMPIGIRKRTMYM